MVAQIVASGLHAASKDCIYHEPPRSYTAYQWHLILCTTALLNTLSDYPMRLHPPSTTTNWCPPWSTRSSISTLDLPFSLLCLCPIYHADVFSSMFTRVHSSHHSLIISAMPPYLSLERRFDHSAPRGALKSQPAWIGLRFVYLSG